MAVQELAVTAKRWARWAGVASVLWLLAAAVAAQGPHRPPGRNVNGGGPQRMMPAEQRPAQLAPREDSAPGSGKRLSPEERRQLRRDVHEAGRDLYPDRMPAGRREPRGQ
ncbi:MAG: hypothetical protein Q8O34_11570 [Rhodocyclaceae bacterium]|nr:hypothetical protein [Rhodocyclaceae bacterium]